MVPDSPDVQAVLAGEGGVFEHAQPGALIIDFSSIRPDVAAALAAEGAGRGFRMLDAPVSGGEQGAIEGVLSIMVGGAADDFEAAAPVFDVVGKTIVHVGPAGSGQTVKAANQLMVAVTSSCRPRRSCSSRPTASTPRRCWFCRAGSPATRCWSARAPRSSSATSPWLPDRVAPQGPRDRHCAAREADVVIPLGAVAAQLVSSLKAQGDGGLDHSALLKLVARLSGRQE